jgi:hypothetical protein
MLRCLLEKPNAMWPLEMTEARSNELTTSSYPFFFLEKEVFKLFITFQMGEPGLEVL